MNKYRRRQEKIIRDNLTLIGEIESIVFDYRRNRD
jgi:hypothetical protein